MAIREDKSRLPTGSSPVDELSLSADTNPTLGVSTSQFALLGQRHVYEDNMHDTLYGAVRTGNSVVVGELTGDHPDVARPDPSGVTTLVTETSQNRQTEDLEQRQRAWATEATGLGAEDLKPGDTRLLSMLGNPFLSFLADQVLSLPQAATVDEAIARGDYSRANALKLNQIALEKADGINQDGTAHIDRQPGQLGDGAGLDGDLTPSTKPHFENGMYYDSYGGHYDNYGYTFKDGSYKDVSGNLADAKTNTITAADTGAHIDIPADLHQTAAQVLKGAWADKYGPAAALSASTTKPVPGHPPSHTAGREAHPMPGTAWGAKVLTENDIHSYIDRLEAEHAQNQALHDQAVHGVATTLQAVTATDAQNKIGFIHRDPGKGSTPAKADPAAAAATVGPSAADATWYSDGKGGYFDNLGGYYDTKGGYWDPKGGYTDAKGGYLDPKGGYTWPDGSFLDKSFNYVDKSGNMTTAQGDYYKARPGEDFKAELQAAATNGTTFAPPALGAGDVPAEWRAKVAAQPADAVSVKPDDVVPAAQPGTGPTWSTKLPTEADIRAAIAANASQGATPVVTPVLTPVAASTVTEASRITPIAIPSSASPLSSNILSGVDLTSFQMTTPAPDATSPFSLFSGFRDDFDTGPKAGKFMSNLNMPSLLDPAPAATPPAATAATLPKAAPVAPAPKAT